MKLLDRLRVVLFNVFLISFVGGVIGVALCVGDGGPGRAAGAGWGAISGGALVGMAILYHAEKISDKGTKDTEG